MLFLFQQVAEIGAREMFHHDEVCAVFIAKIENADNVAVFQPRDNLRFAKESTAKLIVCSEAGGENFDGDGFSVGGAGGTIDFRHAATCD